MTNLSGFGAVDTGIGTSNGASIGDEDMAAVLSVGWLSTCVFCVGTLCSDTKIHAPMMAHISTATVTSTHVAHGLEFMAWM